MRKFHLNSTVSSVVLWGSAWALGELTLGHGLHLFGFPGLAGLVMFPLALTMMVRVYRDTGRRGAVLACAAVAAGLKLLDLFLPAPNPFTVINPALAILGEGLAAAVFLPLGYKATGIRRLAALGLTALAWRGLYAGLVSTLGIIFTVPSLLALGPSQIFNFFVLESLANTAVLFPGFHLLDIKGAGLPRLGRPYPASALILTAAAAAQIIF
jgi:uncharacterized membrane protein YhaH (DUF805 family)